MRRVVITGEGAISPLGANGDDLWRGLLESRSGVRRLSRLANGASRVTTGGEVLSVAPDCAERDLVIAVLANSVSPSGEPIIEKMNAAISKRLSED